MFHLNGWTRMSATLGAEPRPVLLACEYHTLDHSRFQMYWLQLFNMIVQ